LHFLDYCNESNNLESSMGSLSSLRLFKSLLHLFYPILCVGCRRPLIESEQVLCANCHILMPVTNYHNHTENDTAVRLAGRVPFNYATTYAYFTHEGLLQNLLHGLKYNDRKEIGDFLGALFGHSLQDTQWINNIDLIVPVPLHPDKEAGRGYNQSFLIAEGMSKVLKIPVNNSMLKRIRQTESQTKKSRTERLRNMEGAFVAEYTNNVNNAHVLLVDDVLTTGATLEACALTLMADSNISVSFATIGIAV